ncbi:MAG: hypothetical protein JO128_09790 [Alphaproteobacteria bacterium]|nr:hypothetical protein [Alphaproteobacteria bacterium]
MGEHFESETGSFLSVLRTLAEALNPASLWQALQDADEGVCLMAVPVRVRSNNPRRR